LRTLRNLDKLGVDQQKRVSRLEKELSDYRIQADRPFEHEERLKQLLGRQAELNSLLDLDKGDHQGAALALGDAEVEPTTPSPSRSHNDVAKMAAANMRASRAAIREMPISERTSPHTGQVSARVVARNSEQIAFAASPNSFFVVASGSFGSDIQIGERVSLRFQQGAAW
jgi:hypothetical protein